MRVALLLAGGEGRRFGRRDKLLEHVGGEPLLAHALRAARAGAQRTILVLPPGFARRRALVKRLRWPGLMIRTAPDARAGIGASLSAGLRALRPVDHEAVIFLADMPFARSGRHRLTAGCDALRPIWAGQPGHPVLVRTAAIRGWTVPSEAGLAALLDRRQIAEVAGSEGCIIDIDTPAALRRLRYRIATRAGAFRMAKGSYRC
ncbi:molybdenum cofactor cytidylyltransferase [Sphingomonas vulcanisoli]|uniref:Molybdenum cofactor cytidylyltransferase n=1 Tax=Sphingomonas vulcanisoli TaxID=1658060 RepID=A0ABX0TXZ1_9SPHN|nr:NTP transferase domain-containing protein [Sphingomonas vulcanisoli]NIJ09064.1 molybdenum cofactor cytidylyltransferase [Sphingomonas vulcanisoli]